MTISVFHAFEKYWRSALVSAGFEIAGTGSWITCWAEEVTAATTIQKEMGNQTFEHEDSLSMMFVYAEATLCGETPAKVLTGIQVIVRAVSKL